LLLRFFVDFFLFLPTRKTKTNGIGVKGGEGARQLLGVKGGSKSDNIWAIRLQLCKPVTWIPLIWGVACGAAASGNFHTWTPFNDGSVPGSLYVEDALKAFACMILSGPILTGYTQTLNDWEDREIDAINEPDRPIPSGAISETEVQQQIYGLWFLGVGLSYLLDQWAGLPFLFLYPSCTYSLSYNLVTCFQFGSVRIRVLTLTSTNPILTPTKPILALILTLTLTLILTLALAPTLTLT
jgi:4-hydroxybenzoate polyprenyltransferase